MSGHFSEVLVVEPEYLIANIEDESPSPSDPKRKRILQYSALHGFQPVNLQVLRRLFPSFDDEAKAAGARILPTNYNTHVSGIPNLSPEVYMSRAAYETLLRKLAARSCPNVRFMHGTVTGVQPSAHDTRKIGWVSVRLNDNDKACENLPATLVVDCTGYRRSAGREWLERAGFGVPLEDQALSSHQIHIKDLCQTYDPKMRYVSHTFQVRPELEEKLGIPGGYKRASFLYSNFSDPELDNKSVLMAWSEPNKLSLAIGGWDLEGRPRGVEEIKAVLQSIRVRNPIPEWIYELLDMLVGDELPEARADIRVPPLSYIRYDKGVNLPTNFCALGDSVMRVNPVFGQGCAKACIGAVTLDRALREAYSDVDQKPLLPSNFGERFWDLHIARVHSIWTSTKAMDYSYSSTIPVCGESLSEGKFGRWYRDQLIVLCVRNQSIAERVWSVNMFLSPPMAPSLVVRVLIVWAHRKLVEGVKHQCTSLQEVFQNFDFDHWQQTLWVGGGREQVRI